MSDAATSRRAPPRHPDLPEIPQDDDGPVFNAPWQAQVFATTLQLYDQGHFTWPEWVEHLSAEVAAAEARGDPDLGDGYYLHWLTALEKIITAKGITSVNELADRKAAWVKADHDRGFGEPLVLGRDHGH